MTGGRQSLTPDADSIEPRSAADPRSMRGSVCPRASIRPARCTAARSRGRRASGRSPRRGTRRGSAAAAGRTSAYGPGARRGTGARTRRRASRASTGRGRRRRRRRWTRALRRARPRSVDARGRPPSRRRRSPETASGPRPAPRGCCRASRPGPPPRWPTIAQIGHWSSAARSASCSSVRSRTTSTSRRLYWGQRS